jgi:hypothetical protein
MATGVHGTTQVQGGPEECAYNAQVQGQHLKEEVNPLQGPWAQRDHGPAGRL